MASKYQRLFPSTFELISLIFITVLLIVLGNSKQLLDYYGLNATNNVLKQGAGETITQGLGKIDNLSFTNQVVTFLIWAAVGLLCFSIAQAIARGYHEFQREEALSSNRYVHPSTFIRAVFWRHVIINFVTLVIAFALLAVLLYAFFGYVLAIGLTYTRVFLQGVSIFHLGYFILGAAVIYVGLVALALAIHLLVQRQRLFN